MATPKKVLILGGGTGGLIISNELRKLLSSGEAEITVVDRNERSEFRPSYLYVAFGYREPHQVSLPLSLLERKGIRFVQAEVQGIDAANRSVETSAGTMDYDILVVSLGAETVDIGYPSPWELDLALKTREALAGFRGGTLVVGIHSNPYRCPPAPYETAMLAHFYLETRGLRDRSRIVIVSTMKRPFENFGPLAAKMMSQMLEEMGIEHIGVGGSPAITSIEDNVLEAATGERIKFDAAFIVPPHRAPKPVAESELVKNGWAAARNPAHGDFRSEKYDDVYVVGDVVAPNVPLGMAGTILHSYSPYVVSNIVADVKGVSIGQPTFRVFGTCALDVGGFGMAAACDFTPFVQKKKPYPDCFFLPPAKPVRIFKEFFEKMYFAWLLGEVP